MPSPALRRALATTLGTFLTAAILAGCSIDSPPTNDALAGAATATLMKRSSIVCAGDPTSAPARSTLVAYSSLTGSTFAGREAQAAGNVLRLGRTSLLLKDFKAHAATYDGGVLGLTAGGLVGSGMSKTTVRLIAHSSTKSSKVPSDSTLKTNQLSVLRVVHDATVLRGFTLKGTAQGHLYNGLRVEAVKNLRADHVRVWAIPGDNHQQPGETFGINDYKTVGSQWNHIREDGKGVGASGFGVNGAKDIRICDAVAKNNPTGMGFAFWQSSGITCTGCRAYDNGFSGFNFERTTGRVTLIRPDASGNKYDMRIASDRGSAKFVIRNPVLQHGVWTISMPRTWFVKNKQRTSDVSLFIHGNKRNDLLRFRWY